MFDNYELDEIFSESLRESQKENTYRLNFGVYYTPRF